MKAVLNGGDAATARVDFLNWLAAVYPGVYEHALIGQSGMAGIFDNVSWANIIKGIDDALKIANAYKTDKDRIKINAARAAAGCAPIVDWNAAPPPCTGSTTTGQYGVPAMTLDRYIPWVIGGSFVLGLAMLLKGGK